jgi:hypothetical protein
MENTPSTIVVTMLVAAYDAVCTIARGASQAGVAHLPAVWR